MDGKDAESSRDEQYSDDVSSSERENGRDDRLEGRMRGHARHVYSKIRSHIPERSRALSTGRQSVVSSEETASSVIGARSNESTDEESRLGSHVGLLFLRLLIR